MNWAELTPLWRGVTEHEMLADLWRIIALECDYPTICSLKRCNRQLRSALSEREFWLAAVRRRVSLVPFTGKCPPSLLFEVERAFSRYTTDQGKGSYSFEAAFVHLACELDERTVEPGFERFFLLKECLQRAFDWQDARRANYFVDLAVAALSRGRKIEMPKLTRLQTLRVAGGKRLAALNAAWDGFRWLVFRLGVMHWKLAGRTDDFFRRLSWSLQYRSTHDSVPNLAYLHFLILAQQHRSDGRCPLRSVLESVPRERRREALARLKRETRDTCLCFESLVAAPDAWADLLDLAWPCFFGLVPALFLLRVSRMLLFQVAVLGVLVWQLI